MSLAPMERLGEEFEVPRTRIVDRLTDPLGGVALVGIDTDPQPLLRTVAQEANKYLDGNPSPTIKRWRYSLQFSEWVEARGCMHSPDEIDQAFPLTSPMLPDIAEALTDLLKPLRTEVENRSTMHGASMWVTQQKSSNREWETNKSAMVFWGATRPGFSVRVNNRWVPVDNVPAGKVLLVRGADFARQPQAVVTRWTYRSRSRRYEGLAW